MAPKIDSHIRALPATIPFIAPERTERETGKAFLARLGANEGNWGCSPLAKEAMAKAAKDNVGNYCDPECYDLRSALASHLSIDKLNLVCGAGIDNLLGLIVRIFSSRGDKILTSLGAYPTFNYHVNGYDRELLTVPYWGDHEDLSGLALAAQKHQPSIIYLSNPDNPMGSWWSKTDIVKFMDAIPENSLLILDEAYGETAPVGTLPDIDVSRGNVLRLRTFSKAYGLAGLRCGYAFGHADLISPFEKVRDHFGVNIMAQHAALAALGDQQWLGNTLRNITKARARIKAIATSANLTPIASATNFVTIDCERDGAFAMQVLDGLMQRGIFVRKPMALGLDRCIRISAGRDEELDAFETALAQTLGALNA